MVLICNGGSHSLLKVGEMQETVQTRLMRLVTDQQILLNASQAENILDFQIVDVIVNRLV